MGNLNKYYFVYIISNKKDGVLYVGVTNNLARRMYEHKNSLMNGFSKRYNTHVLVYCESFYDIKDAILREKRIKKWKRDWKIQLIEKNNPDWKDLSLDLF